MKTYRIKYKNVIPNVSNRRRVALQLKSLYWKEREIPKEWYWFENKIELKEVAAPYDNCVDLICADELHESNTWFPPVIMELRTNRDVDAILCLQGNVENNWITIFSRPY